MTTSDPKPSPAPSPEGADLLRMLLADGVVSGHADLFPLTGGVSSEIYLVTDAGRRFVVKRALPQLKVEEVWLADPARNLNEQAYLRYVGSLLPDAVPAVLHASREHCYFTMEFLGDGFTTWKAELMAGRCDAGHASRAGATLAVVHAASRGRADLLEQFDTTAGFVSLRVDPYLTTTGHRHPDLRPHFDAEAARLVACREALVHGDYSPKNLLVRSSPDRLVVLDCEVAWYGDPAFDVAFLLNHLLLKSLYHGGGPFLRAARAAAAAHAAGLHDAAWAAEVDRRAARLVPMLMLARVDGKSPAEYLTAAHRSAVRAFTPPLIQAPPATLAELFSGCTTLI